MLDIDLNNFTGTEAYHRWTPLSRSVLTDGTKYVADKLQAYWLFDAIASHIDFGDLPDLDMYFSTLTTFNKTGTLSIEDGNGGVLATQGFEYTDFPLTEIKIWSKSTATEERGLSTASGVTPFFVHMLPSEY
jgi:hypothetical protein